MFDEYFFDFENEEDDEVSIIDSDELD